MPVLDKLNEKYGPAPLWMWGLGTAALGTWYLIHRKNKQSQANGQATQAAADQTNTNLGSASQLANLFEVAGLMPYQGGDTYINVSQPTHHPPIHGGQPPRQVTGSTPHPGSVTSFEVKTVRGDTWSSIAKKFGISEQHLKDYNANISNRSGLESIDVGQQLRPGQHVAIPWLNQ